MTEMIRQLEADRERHARAMAEIDQVLQQVGHILGALDGQPGLPPLELNFAKRRSFELTGEQSVLKFVRERGNPSTAEINTHWKAEGRRGLVNVTLLHLIKRGQLRRESDPTVRGSRYVLVADGAAPSEGDRRDEGDENCVESCSTL